MCENCKKLTVRCVQYEMEIKALEIRVDYLEEELIESEAQRELQIESEDSFSETRRQMLEDRD